jgi:serine/threonine protein kinase
MKQILLAVELMHNKQIVHRDLKLGRFYLINFRQYITKGKKFS